MRSKPHPVLLQFEQSLGLGPTKAAMVLGIGLSTYAHYRSGFRELPEYHKLHIETLGLLPRKDLDRVIRNRSTPVSKVG